MFRFMTATREQIESSPKRAFVVSALPNKNLAGSSRSD